jgi:hypothetical protein
LKNLNQDGVGVENQKESWWMIAAFAKFSNPSLSQ